jgi:hypothetical protein
MSDARRDPDRPKFRWQDEVDQVFASANPNPTREGCLLRDELIALARHERPVSDPGYVHLTRCSPCYREVRGFHEAWKRHRRQRRLTMVAAAAVVVAVGVGAWYAVTRGSRADLLAELDLRPYAVTRGAPADSGPPPLVLPRGRLTLTMKLPVGFEPGVYDLQLLDSSLTSRASATGTATMEDFVTTLRTSVDLGSVSAGPYQMALRRQGEDWQLFPARVK